jgi:hypothetical protein
MLASSDTVTDDATDRFSNIAIASQTGDRSQFRVNSYLPVGLRKLTRAPGAYAPGKLLSPVSPST